MGIDSHKLLPQLSQMNDQAGEKRGFEIFLFGMRGDKAIRAVCPLVCLHGLRPWINNPIMRHLMSRVGVHFQNAIKARRTRRENLDNQIRRADNVLVFDNVQSRLGDANHVRLNEIFLAQINFHWRVIHIAPTVRANVIFQDELQVARNALVVDKRRGSHKQFSQYRKTHF